MTTVLFVCLGNICRSPLAEALFKDHTLKMGLGEHYLADSCGTAHYHIGSPPDPRTIQNAEKNGIIIRHLGRQFGPEDFTNFDHIFPMDHSNYYHLKQMVNSQSWHHKIKLMRTFDPLQDDESVPDPYYGTEKDFQEVFDILNRSTLQLISFLEQKRNDRS